MRKLTILTSIAFLIFSCENLLVKNGDDNRGNTRPLTAKEQALVTSNQEFAFNLLAAVTASDATENIFISPLSVAMALGMTMNGASGQTYADMQAALEFAGLKETEINQTFESLIELLQSIDPEVITEIANSIWIRDGFTVENDFIETNRDYFDAEVATADFTDPATVTTINDWIAANTNGKITDVLDQIPAEAVMYLINAIYYKAIWQYEFDQEYTRPEDFYVSANNSVTVDMMRLTADLQYYADDTVQIVDLPYGRGNYSMTVILPWASIDLDEYIQSFDSQRWNYYLSELEVKTGTVAVPRLRINYKLLMNEALDQLGMGIAFSGQADFSRINPFYDLFISRVIHQTFVQMDEEGTEAAAVTVVEVSLTSVGPVTDFTMAVNRPYLFLIRERESGAILFTGKISRPVWEE
ncbi:MAG: serpin family protein [Candidatus Neomarinimicrobiota bacterium]